MSYVDGYVLPIKTKDIETYTKMAEQAGSIWMEHGALAYVETIADDLNAEWTKRKFTDAADAKDDETVVFAYVIYKSREHRDEVNKKVMEDPRMKDMPQDCQDVVNCKRMLYGGFRAIVEK
jgi:uncharacterized protein YbaA (DUF1428 family)